jgi:Flp pilus assembly protein TadG
VRDHEHGSVSIVVAALMAMALILAMGAADLARVLTGAARAQTAADAAALAAAQELASASSAGVEPADLAAAYAGRNGAVLTSCSCDAGGSEAVVSVTVQVGALMLAPDDRVVTARARAVVELPASG